MACNHRECVAVRTKKIEGWEIQWKYYIRVPVVTEAQ